MSTKSAATPPDRWVTLAMLAHAFLAVRPPDEHARNPAPDGWSHCPATDQRLFITLVVRTLPREHTPSTAEVHMEQRA